VHRSSVHAGSSALTLEPPAVEANVEDPTQDLRLGKCRAHPMATSTSPAPKPSAGETPKSLRLSTAGGPRAPERVRAWLQGAPTGLSDELERNLTLLTCELVNNSVLHGRAGEKDVIEVELAALASGVRARVSDSGPGFAPAARDRPIEEPGGWGLVLVQRVANRWGVEHGERTCVWFELTAA